MRSKIYARAVNVSNDKSPSIEESFKFMLKNMNEQQHTNEQIFSKINSQVIELKNKEAKISK